MMINTKSIIFSEKAPVARENSRQLGGLGAALTTVLNNVQVLTAFCRSNVGQPGFRQFTLLSCAIEMLLTDPQTDIQLPVRLLVDLVKKLEKNNYPVLNRLFELHPADFQKEAAAYLKTRASEEEGRSLKKVIELLRQTNQKGSNYDYRRQEYKNPLLEAYAELPSGLQKEIKSALEDDRNRLEIMVQNYRDVHLFSTLDAFGKTVFLINEYLENPETDNKKKDQLRQLLSSSFYPTESGSYAYLKKLQTEQRLLEKQLGALKAVREYSLLLKNLPRTREERIEWTENNEIKAKTALRSIYGAFHAALNSAFLNKLNQNKITQPELYNILKVISSKLVILSQYGYSIQNILLYIEKEIVSANSQADLKERLLKYYKVIQQSIQASAQSRAA